MKKIKVAFMFQVPSFWPSWDSLYRELINDEFFDVKLFWINGRARDPSQMKGEKQFLESKMIPYEIFSYEKIVEFSPVYMIYQTPYDNGHRDAEAWSVRYKLMGIKIVYIPYGIEISDTRESRYKHFSLPVVLNADEIFIMSETMRQEYNKYCINSQHAKVTGLIRFDALTEGFPILDIVKKKATGRKIVLWKVHFPKVFVENGIKKQATPDINEYLKFVDWMEKEEELFFVFMPHPKFTDDTIDPELREMAIKLLERLEDLTNVYIDRSDDYRNSLVNSDAIIVDRSAVMIEAGIKGVPVLYMYNSDYEEPMTPPVQKILDSYYRGTNSVDMIEFCQDLKKCVDVKKEMRIKTYDECIGVIDGGASKRVKDELIRDRDCIPVITSLKENDRVIVFGAGNIGRICVNEYYQNNVLGIFIIAIVDNNQKAYGSMIRNIEICDPMILQNMDYDHIVIASDKYYREIYTQLTDKMMIPVEKLVNYDQFIVQCKYRT